MTVPQEVKLARHAGDLDDDGHDIYAFSGAAADVSLADAGGYYPTSSDVEAAFQELGSKALGYTAHGPMGTTETFSALVGWHSGTFSANCTATFTGAVAAPPTASMLLELTSDGSSVMTWPGSVVWPGGVVPTLSTTIGQADFILFLSRDGGTTWFGFPRGSAGTVTSVALTVPAEFSIAGSPVTSSGTLAVTKATQSANTVWAGPTSGSAAQPTFRALVADDIAGLTSGIGGHEHVVSEAHLSDGSTTLYTLDQAFEDGSVIAWNTTTLARLGVTEAQPDQATVSAAGTTGDTIMFDYAATVVG